MAQNKHEGCIRGFVNTREAWYGPTASLGPDVINEVTIGMYHAEGGTTGEFKVQWKLMSGLTVPQLHAYDDAWSALTQFPDVLAQMSRLDNANVTPEAFCAMLKECGVIDRTKRQVEKAEPVMALQDQLVAALSTLVKYLSDTDDEGLIEHAEPMMAAREALALAGAK